MKNFTGKFEAIHEETLYRYQQQGFLCGDYVTISKDALKDEHVKKLSKQMQTMIESVMKSKTPLRISYIKSSHAEAPSGPIGAPNIPGCIWADVVIEYAPGMWKDPMTLPLNILEKVDVDSESSTGDTGMSGYPQYSDDIRRQSVMTIKPEEVKATDNRDKKASDEHNLTKKNKKPAFTKKPKDGLKQVNASVEHTFGWDTDVDMLSEAYRTIQAKK